MNFNRHSIPYTWSEDDARDGAKQKSSQSLQISSISCSNRQCDEEIIQVDRGDYYCSRECYHKRLERDDLEVDSTTSQFSRMTILGRGGTGVLAQGVERLAIRVDEQYGRIVTIQKGSYARLQRSLNKNEGKNSKPKPRCDEEKAKLAKLLNMDLEDSSESGSDCDEEGQRSMLSAHDQAGCPAHPPLPMGSGIYIQGFIINIVSPWEVYIQTAEMIQMAEKIESICNGPIDPRLIVEDWLPRVGSLCAAKYEGIMYRARILQVAGDSFRVKFVDYGNEESVKAKDLQQLNPEVSLIPQQCVVIKLSNVRPRRADENMWKADTVQYLIENLDGGIVELELEMMEKPRCYLGKMSVTSTLFGTIRGDLGEALVLCNLAESQD